MLTPMIHFLPDYMSKETISIKIAHTFDSNKPHTPAYEVCISQLRRYVFRLYSDILQRQLLLTTKLLNQGF